MVIRYVHMPLGPPLALGTGICKMYEFLKNGANKKARIPHQVFTTLAVTYHPWKTMVMVEIWHWLAYQAASV